MEWHPARPARPSSNAPSKVGFYFNFVSTVVSVSLVYISLYVLLFKLHYLVQNSWFCFNIFISGLVLPPVFSSKSVVVYCLRLD